MKVLLLFLVSLFFYAVQGQQAPGFLLCYECDRQPDNEACLRSGRITVCLSNQQNCQNEVRRTIHGIEISKRCKQDIACNNNFIQNAAARQCTFLPRIPDSTCRCCCRSNFCNRPNIGCHEDPPEPPPLCQIIRIPRFGSRVCTPSEDVDFKSRKVAVDVECSFACREGYLLFGADKSTCVKSQFSNTAAFDRRPPRCVAPMCFPPRVAPENGDVTCTNGSFLRSLCTYTCNEGYALRGPDTTRCGVTGRWSRTTPPICQPIRCFPRYDTFDRGTVQCTMENFVFSVCTFTCNQGFLLQGSAMSTCEDDGTGDTIGRWTSPPPVCLQIRCIPPHRNPNNGVVSCSNSNREGSVCTFTCNNGFFLNGEDESTCLDDGDLDDEGVWSSEAPTCTAIVCRPPQVAPTNGNIDCSNRNFFGSNCRFDCDDGFFLSGVRNVRCVDDNDGDEEGVWNNNPPTCLRITCVPPQMNPENGDVSCDNGNNLGSVCSFACRDGFAVDGNPTVTCIDDNDRDDDGVWNRDPPVCTPVTCIPHVDPANGRVECTNENNYASECSFRCNPGFFLDGSEVSVCEDDQDGDTEGVWSTPAPTCVRVRCFPPRTNPTNGNVDCSSGNTEGSQCTYTCDPGYFLVGEPVSICVDDNDGDERGEWDNEPPRCIAINCEPAHVDPENGNVDCSDGNTLGSRCEFECDRGYLLRGSTVSVCEDDGDGDDLGVWSEDAPVCIRIRCEPPHIAPDNGILRSCSDENYLNSVCRFECDTGFFLDGATTSRCVDDNDGDELGVWNRPAPVCVQITCNPPRRAPSNGDVECTNSNLFRSVCTFSCEDGFFLDGQMQSRCRDDNDGDADGVWTSEEPTCVRITCNPAHVAPGNGGVVCSDANNLGSDCTFTCDAGYFLNGASVSVCLDDNDNDADGVWDNPAPTCELITCLPPHTAPFNGAVDCTDRNRLNSRCTFDCNRNFFLNGDEVSVCEDDQDGDALGVWSTEAPVCEGVVCVPEHTAPENGGVSCTNGNNANSECTFTCDSGYFLQGSSTSTCEDDEDDDELGVWTSLAPVCVAIVCVPPHQDPTNGMVRCSNSNFFMSLCSFECDTGFFLDGATTSRCVDDNDGDELGVWNRPAPVCVQITCNPPRRAPSNGSVECTNSNLFRSVCAFSCEDGFFLDGQMQSRCRDDNDGDADGVWTSEEPTCVRITCNPAHVAPGNGGVVCSDANNLGSDCTFTCDAGYFLNGASVSVCLDDNDNDADGVWDNPAPTCELITCLPPHTAPFNGAVDCTDRNRLNSRCTFDCNRNFFLNGDEVSVCEDDQDGDALGVWSTDAPVCEGVVCVPEHMAPENGGVSCTNGNNANSECTFTCDSGYFLQGSSTSTCEDDEDDDELGEWTSLAPTCQPIVCVPPHENPPNGMVRCSNSNFFMSVCSFECDDGYFLDGENESTCEDDNDGDAEGRFSSPTPDCVRITCNPPFVDPDDGSVSCSDGNNRDSVCRFTCNAGFYLIGSSMSTCNDDNDNDADGVWTDRAPVCRPITCNPEHVDPADGMVDCTNGNFVGSTCTFTCNDGFFLNGQMESTCTDDGNGDGEGVWTSEAPTCVSILCRPPHVAPENGMVDCSDGNSENSVCRFSCNDGYFLSGEAESTCRDDLDGDEEGVWTSVAPVCLRVFCPPPHENPENGAVMCSEGNNEGSVCRFTCNAGHFLDGSPESTCVDDGDNDQEGVWTSPAPVCVIITCPPPHVNPQNGMVSCSDGNIYLSVCEFTCNRNFFLDGSTTSTCRDDNDNDVEGVWDNPAPTCVQITCAPPHIDPMNGVVGCTDTNNLGSECTFECGLNYFLNGEVVSICEEDNDGDALGVWSSEAPVCEIITCEPPHVAPENGGVSCTTSNILDSVCTFTCEMGFFLNGAATSTCEDNDGDDNLGEWSSPAPTCDLISCPPPHVAPRNGAVSCSNTNLENSVCTFTCEDGFSLIGSAMSTCQDDNDNDAQGEWSSPAPLCVDVSCNPPQEDPQNGMVRCSDENFLGSECTFTCNRGFTLLGSMVTTCEDDNDGDADGAWSLPPPICEQVTCEPPLSAPDNGTVSCSNSNNADSTCTFTCDGGFALLGSAMSTCIDDQDGDTLGEWSTPPPTCQQIVCQPPYTEIADGMVECSNSNLLGSVCTFTCRNDDFVLNGQAEAICAASDEGGAEGFWTAPPPTCDRKSCGDPPIPRANSFRGACTDDNFVGSQCEYACEDYHTRVGARIITCVERDDGTLEWDNPAPLCEPNVCPMQQINNGRVECSDPSLMAPATCDFICNDGFSVFPADFAQNTCMNDSNWSSPPPCCARLCPPFANIDLAIVMDASTSIDEANWERAREFVVNVTDSFTLDRDGGTQIAVIRYNEGVDVGRRILLNRFNVPNRKNGLLRNIRALPYVDSENGTFTGQALEYARTVIFNSNNGDRPNVQNVLLLLTDGQSADDIVAVSNQLREDGVLSFAIGILPPFGVFDERELIQITGSEDRVIIAGDGFDTLDDQFAAVIAEQLCPVPECN